MSMIDRATQRLAGGEHGFTLIETLVAMISGVVVIGATFSILDRRAAPNLAYHRQRAGHPARPHHDDARDRRAALGLHRAKFAPVQKGSSGNKLIFVNAYSKEAVITKTKPTSTKSNGAAPRKS